MLRNLHRRTLTTSLALAFAGLSTAASAAHLQSNVDMGKASSSQSSNVTLVLKLHNQAALEQYIQETITTFD